MRAIYCIALLAVVPCILAAHVHLNEITPEEAQKLIAEQSLDLKYAQKLGEQPLGAFRTGEGERQFYKNGRLIENPDDYVEEVYEASQFHGQDGLGRVMFGYTDHNQARLEARNANGEVRGSYQYIDPNGENIVVQYWSDGLGFHQTDNRPRIVLEPVTETPEVREARLAHEVAWNAAAQAAKANPDPNSDYYNSNANKYDDYQSELEQRQELIGTTRYNEQYPSAAPYAAATNTHSVFHREPAVQETRDNYQYAKPYSAAASGEQVEEVTSEPRGFFYSFDYPVSVIVENAASRTYQTGGPQNTAASAYGQPKYKREVVDDAVDTVAVAAVEEPALINPATLLKTDAEGHFVDAVHDAQVHPKQKVLQ